MELAGRITASPAQIASAVVLILVLRLIQLAVSRLVLSPIAKFPGPKLAALTLWYEFYYDVVQKGRYTWKIKELHEKYGPIIRINPYELHVDDPAFYSKLYTGPTEKRDKWQWSMKLFGMKSATFTTESHDLHRRRRAALNPSFSKAAVTHLEPEIRALVDKLCTRLKEFQQSGDPAELGVIFAALTADVVTEYAFGARYGCLDAPDFNPMLYKAVQANTQTSTLAKQFGWMIPLSRSMPHWMVNALNPLMMQMIYFANYVVGQLVQVIETHDGKSDTPPRPTIFGGILDSDLEPSEKTIPRLMDDGLSVVGAGLSTTADTLRITTFHVLHRPEVLRRLRAELAAAIPDPTHSPPLRALEQLPYLSAVVTEGLRVACGICSRLQRIAPAALPYGRWSIPPGTPVGMTIYLLHHRPDTFPDPYAFRPERWLDEEGGGKTPGGDRLDRYLVHFSRGTRSCVGQNLAMAEIYLALAYLFRRFRLELFETTREDVDIAHDYFVAFPRLDSKGVRVLVKEDDGA